MVELVWRPRAEEDLRAIHGLISADNPVAADRLLATIEAKIMLLADQPRLGVRRSDIRRGARMLVAAPYLILYATEPNTDRGPVDRVRIVRVVDGRRNLTRLL